MCGDMREPGSANTHNTHNTQKVYGQGLAVGVLACTRRQEPDAECIHNGESRAS